MFGERIQQLRQQNNETQEQLADLLGVSRQTIANYEIEKHEPDFDTLNKIATHYSTSTDFILGRSNIKNLHDQIVIHELIKSSKVNPTIVSIINTVNSIIENYQGNERLQLFDDVLKTVSKLL